MGPGHCRRSILISWEDFSRLLCAEERPLASLAAFLKAAAKKPKPPLAGKREGA